MRRLPALLLLVTAATGLLGCKIESENQDEASTESVAVAAPDAQVRVPRTFARTNMVEVVENIYDDSDGNLYIAVSEYNRPYYNDALAEIINKKQAWQARNPDKRIVTMSVVAPGVNRASVIGLLVQYEKIEVAPPMTADGKPMVEAEPSPAEQ